VEVFVKIHEKYKIHGKNPENGVIIPETVVELASNLAEMNASKSIVAPVGGGTRLHVGNSIEKYDYAIDVTGLNKIISYNAADLTCTVEAGIRLNDLKKELSEKRQFLSIDAALPIEATVGGTLASNAPGLIKWQLSHMRDTVIGMQVVLASGTITKSGGQVVKNVSGYDMSRLHIGAFGTLGIITQVSFKLSPTPNKTGTVVTVFDDFESASQFAQRTFVSYAMPLGMVCIDNALAYSIGYQISDRQFAVFTLLGGRDKAYQRQVGIVNNIANNSKNTREITGIESDAVWDKLRDYPWSDNENSQKPDLVLRINTKPSNIMKSVAAVTDLINRDGVKKSMIIQPGFGSIYIFAHVLESLNDFKSIELIEQLRTILKDMKSSFVFEKVPINLNDLVEKWGYLNDDSLKLMKSLKHTYDPDNTLNPGRMWGQYK
jgi:glycolate oxidase FAD binding subunit